MTDSRALRLAAALSPLAPGRFSLELSSVYTIMGHPHGGYLQCVMASGALNAAASEGATHSHAIAVTTNFVRASQVGPAELVVTVRRVGRGASFAHVELFQDGAVVAESLVTLATLSEDPARYQDAELPAVAPLKECARAENPHMGILGALDQRLDPRFTSWWRGERSARGEILGWLRLDDGEGEWDPWGLLFASDALPPASFPLGSSGWVPTLQLTSYVHRVPVGEWLRVRQWAIVIADNVLDERLELFDERGALVASSQQVALVRFAGEET